MRAVTLEEWRETFFSEKARPSLRAAIRYCRDGEIPAQLGVPVHLGKRWLILLPIEQQEQESVGYISLTGDPIVDEILKESCDPD